MVVPNEYRFETQYGPGGGNIIGLACVDLIKKRYFVYI